MATLLSRFVSSPPKIEIFVNPWPEWKRKAGSDVGRSQVSDVLVLQTIPQCCELKNESIILPSASDPVITVLTGFNNSSYQLRVVSHETAFADSDILVVICCPDSLRSVFFFFICELCLPRHGVYSEFWKHGVEIKIRQQCCIFTAGRRLARRVWRG